MIKAYCVEDSNEVMVEFDGEAKDVLTELGSAVELIGKKMTPEGRKILRAVLNEAMERGEQNADQ